MARLRSKKMGRTITRREFTKTFATATSGAGFLALLPSCASMLRPPDVRELLRSDLTDLGGTSQRLRAQVDHVLELEVITGAGELLVCSVDRNPELFYSLLAGFGQSALTHGRGSA